jgi:hypothetical protein
MARQVFLGFRSGRSSDSGNFAQRGIEQRGVERQQIGSKNAPAHAILYFSFRLSWASGGFGECRW